MSPRIIFFMFGFGFGLIASAAWSQGRENVPIAFELCGVRAEGFHIIYPPDHRPPDLPKALENCWTVKAKTDPATVFLYEKRLGVKMDVDK